MEYRFSLTRRLAALGAFAIVALLVLLFALGFLLGQRAAHSAEPAPAPVPALASPASAVSAEAP